LEARFAGGVEDEQIRSRFRALREADYRELAAEARAVVDRLRNGAGAPDDPTAEPDRRRLQRRLEAVRRIDFFHADGREEVEALMATIDRHADSSDKARTAPTRETLQARTWVTRAGVKVDRMASAWLIRRFIDPAATFAFVAPESPPVADGVRFDMFEGEFTHDGNRCTFEVLLDVTGRPSDGGLAALAQIVHDIDLRDDRYQRPETAGVAAFIDGIVARSADDQRRLAESAPLFDALYASLAGPAR
jgi:hypothetical protein